MRNTLRQVGVALQRKDFRWWFGAQVLSASGAMTQGVALSWLILQRTGDPLPSRAAGAFAPWPWRRARPCC